MPVDYETIVDTDLSFLKEASRSWQDMSDKFDDLHASYRDDVKGVAEARWKGISATLYSIEAQKTLEEYEGARKEAKAVSSLLDEAHTVLKDMRQRVLDEAKAAREAGMHVSATGKCAMDLDKVEEKYGKEKADEYREDKAAREKLETEWTDSIAAKVKDVRDADRNFMEALKSDPSDGGKGTEDGFNGALKGDAGAANADRAEKLYDKLADGEKLSAHEMSELRFLTKQNEDDPEYSRTLLDSMGPDGVIKAANSLDNLAYYDDKDHRKQYLGLEKSLANSLATATKVDSDGKPGTADAFSERWRKRLRADGVKEYDLTLAEKTGHDSDQKVRGYQSLVSLMEQSDEKFGRTFLHGVADDIRDAEEDDKDIWDLEGDFSGEKDKKTGLFDHTGTGRFANDPLDGILGVMSKDPDTATSYFDPATADGEDRLTYLQKDRDWDLVDKTHSQVSPGGMVQIVPGQDAEDKDARSGFGAALEAAMTGHAAGDKAPDSVPDHSEAQRRVFEQVVNSWGGTGKDSPGEMPDNIRQNMGNAVAYYQEDVHDLLSGRGDTYQEAGKDITAPTLTRFMRDVGDDGGAFRTMHDSQINYIAHRINGLDHDDFTVPPGGGRDKAEGVMQDSGQVMGTMDRLRADVLASDRDDAINQNNWAKTYQYHLIGAPLTPVPVVGDGLQRLVDVGAGLYAEKLNNDVTDQTKAELISSYEEKGQPRLTRMVEKQAEAVGVTNGEMHDSGTRGARLLQSSGQSYAAGLGAAEGATGSTV
ncbi:hypothetical protein [Streptomyces daliensis]|uniref:Uncharacterized protein n=1 Tax=Streptomyces daliensis TaxID=299421 RepID=A0A8T4IWE8_9ACTN|nr:hypothetical protein [Streptomyces daliensis]